MNLNNIEDRKKLAELAFNHASSKIALRSIKENKVYSGHLKKLVIERLIEQFDESTVKSMPIISSVNLCKRIANKEASIYRKAPVRDFKNLNPAQKDAISEIYKYLEPERKLTRANKIYKYSNQCFLQVIHRKAKKKLELRVLKKHQVFTLPCEDKPTEVGTYVIIGGDASKCESVKFSVWTKEFNFIMDINGNVLSKKDGVDDLKNNIGIIPIIDISDEEEKEGDTYAESDRSLIDFTIQINVALSDLFNIMRNQGYAIPVIKGPDSLIKSLKQIKVGVNKVICLPTDKESEVGKTSEVDFQFVAANPNLEGSIETISTLLSAFLSSRGVDPKTINFKGDNKTFASGWERFLALIESFEASQDDVYVFNNVEQELYDIITAFHNAFLNDPTKLEKYFTSSIINDSSLSISFAGPEMIETKSEKLERLKKESDYGVISKIEMLQQYHGLTRDEAIEKAKQIKTDNAEDIRDNEETEEPEE